MKLALLAILIVGSGCSRQQVSSAPEAATTENPPALAITLERTACSGRCPIYRLEVTPAGVVRYQGTANVSHLGAATGQVPAERVSQLLRELDEAGYFSFASSYTSTQPACGRYATDLPTAITTVTLNGRTKRIEHDYGCGAAPGALVVLEQRIDEELDSAQWTGR